jgi:hypothetical protein
LSLAIGSKCVVRPNHSRGDNARKIGSHNITIQTSSRWRVCIRLADIETRGSAEFVTELPNSFITESKVQSQEPPDPIVILNKSRTFPDSELAIE